MINKNKKIYFLLFSLLAVSSFFIGNFVNASATGVVADAVSGVAGSLISAIIWILGGILFVLIYILIWISGYNDFINSPAVINGWVIVRDLCNMFFILILLVVAFATILRVESYQWKKILPKLLIMAVLINFSKTICGLIIDFSQVIMLTFVNGFKDMGSANLTTMLGIKDILSINLNNTAEISLLSVLGSYILALLYALISVIVVGVIVGVLVVRMIMLWVYIVLSPIAFLAAAFPAGLKYSSQWWSEFSKQVVVGPVLAFFIWLSFVSVGTNTTAPPINTPKPGDTGGTTQISSSQQRGPIAGVTQSGSPDNMLKFIISIGMLIGGLMITQQMGGVAASIAGKGMAAIQKGGALMGKGALLPLVGAKTLASYGIDKLHEKTGVDVNVARVWTGLQEKRAEIKKKRYGKGMIKASEAMRDKGRLYGALAMTGTPGSAWEQLTTTKGWGQRFRGGKRSKEKIEGEGGLANQRKEHEEAIENIKNKEYDDALELSQALTPQQRHDLSVEQVKLVGELDELSKAIEGANRKISLAKTSKDEVSEKMATDELESLKVKKQSKINLIAENEGMLKKPEHSLKDIFKAQDLVESKNNEINKHKKDIGTINDQILKFKPIMDFDAIAMQGSLEAEEMKKIDHIKDREELSSIARDAMKSGDKIRFNAASLKLAKDGNENDGLLNNFGYKSNADGLKKMMWDISHRTTQDGKLSKNYMGYSDQDAKALGMKISYAAEANNHWGTARAFIMQDGRYRNATAKEQAQAAISEIAKMDPQGAARSLNRLGYGGETPDGKFELDEFGLALLKAIGPRLALSTSMGRFNPNAFPRLAEKHNIDLLVKVGVAPEFISQLQAKAATPTLKALDAVDQVFNSNIKTT